MTELTDPLLPGFSAADRLPDWSLPRATARILARVAPTRAPILCLGCYGAAFARVAAAIHGASQRDRLILVDLRSARDAIVTGLIRASTSPRATIAIDGIDLLDRDTQGALVRTMERDAPRLVSGSALALDELRELCRPEFFALVSTITVRAPAIGARAHDIGDLAQARLDALAGELGRVAPRLAPSAVAALASHSWPGDANELEALLLRTALAVESDSIEAGDLRWHPEACLPDDPRAGVGPAAVRSLPAGLPSEGASEPGAGSPAANGSCTARAEPAVSEADAGIAAAAEAHAESDATEALAVELAHQLKNPLVTVKTFVQNVAQLSSDPADLARFRDLTDEAITRMDEALEELLSFARLGPPRPASVEVVELLREALRDAWATFAAKEITVSGPNGASLQVVGDRDHLRTALGTLARYLLESIEPRTALAVAIEHDAIRLSYRESGAATHLRGITGLSGGSFPLALLLVRSALARLGSGLDVSHREGVVEVALRFATG
jgi:signal transduction histidine kinase